jgi:predicted CxxxxCH...CXXCH cytochrome family protein
MLKSATYNVPPLCLALTLALGGAPVAAGCEGGHHGLEPDADGGPDGAWDGRRDVDAGEAVHSDVPDAEAREARDEGDVPVWDGALDGDDPDAPLLECNSCHGDDDSPAPPGALDRDDETTDRGVGAHRSHLRTGSSWHADITCDECHVVPESLLVPGHIDTDLPAELTWGARSTVSGASPSFDGTTCAGAYCHGATLADGGGTVTAPAWTRVDGTQAACGSCHGLPPGGGHPSSTACEMCHGGVIGPRFTFVAPERHIDGTVDVMVGGCDSCHGGGGETAPPADTSGNTATTARGVGAHRSHLADSTWHRPLACADCHRVPATLMAAGHIDTALPAELSWSALAAASGASPSFDGTTCEGTYCHGTTLAGAGGSLTAPVWTRVDGTQAACGTCHGSPPPLPHPQSPRCDTCHGVVMSSPTTFSAPARHVDGVVDLGAPPGSPCDTCHGVAPATGSHATHFAAGAAHASYGGLETAAVAGGPSVYGFGCGHCHGRSSWSHMDGHVDVELFDPSAPVGSLVALNPPTALYSVGAVERLDADGIPYTLGSCADLYCHSSGHVSTAVRSYAPSPAWGGSLPGGPCAQCHGDPPIYPTAGAAVPGANSHYDSGGWGAGWPSGHLLGIHWEHNGTNAAADTSTVINCNICHAATTTYAADTTFADPTPSGATCAGTGCHTATTVPPAGNPGRITDTAHHVNGVAEVVFSPVPFRTTASLSSVPTGWTRTPTYDETVLSTWSSYNPATMTCANIPCHVGQTTVRWGATSPEVGGCDCHPMH